MALTLESIQSASVNDASLVITKPVSLAVGDTMLAGIYFSDDGSGGGGVTTPSGWTLESTTDSGSGPSNDRVMAVFSKVADSSDVAASNFTFVRSGADTTYHMIGHILRITEYGLDSGSTTGTGSTASTTVTATGFTPTRANTLFVAFFANTNFGPLVGNSSVALATDNPSWTEQVETTASDSSSNSSFSVFTATRSQATATGTITGTCASSTTERSLHVYAISPQLSGSVNPTTYVNAYAFNVNNPSVGVDAITEQPTLETSGARFTDWTNTTKPSTTWTNTPKI